MLQKAYIYNMEKKVKKVKPKEGEFVVNSEPPMQPTQPGGPGPGDWVLRNNKWVWVGNVGG